MISDSTIRARVPRTLKQRVRDDVRQAKARDQNANESSVVRAILSRHYGLPIPEPYKEAS